MNLLICYHSRYGSTQQYAEWLHEQVGGELTSIKDISQYKLSEYAIFVFGGYVHAGKITIRNLIQRNWPVAKHKHVIVYSTSGTPPSETPTIQAIFDDSFPAEIRERLTYFPLMGRMETEKWKLSDRLLTHVGSWIVKDPDVKQGMVSDVDGVRREDLEPLVKHIQSLLAAWEY